MHPDELYLGMKFSELISAMGLVFGPIAAVVISQALEHFRRRRDERTHILRFLLATRATPADTNYVGAINLIPVYFNRHEKVMAAWHSYMNAVRYSAQPGDEAVQNQQFAAKQTALIFAIMQALKLKLSEGEIQSEAYISKGFVAREALYLTSLEALPKIAAAVEKSANSAEVLVALATRNAARTHDEK